MIHILSTKAETGFLFKEIKHTERLLTMSCTILKKINSKSDLKL